MKEERTDYNFSNDYLMFKVGDVVGYMNRDVTEFTARSVTQIDIDAFEAEGNAFEAMLPDSYYQSLITIEVTAKNNARTECQKQARKIAGYVEQAFGSNSGQYKSLNYGKLSNSKDRSFITSARLVAKASENLLATVSTYGLTQIMIDNLIAEAQVMEDKLHAIALKESERDIQTDNRIIAGNALYKNLAKYCQIGKSIWEDVSEAKYNDYVISPTVHSGLAKPQNLIAEIDPMDNSLANLSWEAVTGADSYKIYYSNVPDGQPSDEFTEIQEVFGVIEAIVGIDFQNRNYWKIRAFGGGKSSSYSDEVFIQT